MYSIENKIIYKFFEFDCRTNEINTDLALFISQYSKDTSCPKFIITWLFENEKISLKSIITNEHLIFQDITQNFWRFSDHKTSEVYLKSTFILIDNIEINLQFQNGQLTSKELISSPMIDHLLDYTNILDNTIRQKIAFQSFDENEKLYKSIFQHFFNHDVHLAKDILDKSVAGNHNQTYDISHFTQNDKNILLDIALQNILIFILTESKDSRGSFSVRDFLSLIEAKNGKPTVILHKWSSYFLLPLWLKSKLLENNNNY